MLTKTPVSDDQVVAIVAPLGTVRRVEPLSGGLFASVLRADLADRPPDSGSTRRTVPSGATIAATWSSLTGVDRKSVV